MSAGDHTEVYPTARGPLARIASPYAARARRRRHERFFALTGLPPGGRVLDVGCGRIGLRALEPALDITGIDVQPARATPGRSCRPMPPRGCHSPRMSSTSCTATA